MNQAPPAPAARPRVRTTQRAESPSGPLACKLFRRSPLERLGLATPAAAREHAMLSRLRALGLPVPEPVELSLHGGPRGEDLLATRWVEGAIDLAAAWDGADPGSPERRRIAREAGGLVRSLHELGFVHRDLHGGNVLIAPDGRLVLLDLQRARRDARERARLGDLFDLGHHFLPRTRPGERLRFLHSALPGLREAPRAKRRALLQSIARRALRHRLRFLEHHERRASGGGRAFLPIRCAGLRGVARAEWAAALPAIDAALRSWPPAGGRLVHRGGGAEVWRVETADLPFPLAIKRFEDRGLLRRLARGSRAARAWLNLFRLQMAGFPTPRCVLFAESPSLRARPSSVLVMEFLDGHETLRVHVERRGVADARPALERLAADLARLHDEGLSHRDLKAENLLVPGGGGRAACVDADGVRRREAVALERAARDLMRLNASFRDPGAVTWRDRLRFLAAYRRARRLLRPAWRPLVSEVARLTAIKWQQATAPR